jgi:4-hydroxy-3-methylbut-2-enyl diphosphate reductase
MAEGRKGGRHHGGASAPEVLVDDVIEALRRIGPVQVSVLPGREENIEFRLPANDCRLIISLPRVQKESF